MSSDKEFLFQLKRYDQKGLYLIFEDARTMELTESTIEKLSGRYWADTSKIPPEVRSAADFQLCSLCPEKDTEGLCFALQPVLPLIDDIDKYVSYDKVTAIYRGDETLLHVGSSTMQEALQYISILGLIHYCRVGRQYRKYFVGVIPIAGSEETVRRIYLNMYWVHKGNLREMNDLIERFKNDIVSTSANQIKRLHLLCKNDAFINAFYNAQVAAEILSMDMESVLKQVFSVPDTK
jgi:hypothetical protein